MIVVDTWERHFDKGTMVARESVVAQNLDRDLSTEKNILNAGNLPKGNEIDSKFWTS